MKSNRQIAGKIKIKPIEFSEIYELEVKRANRTSGRIYLPSEFIGKKVYVLIDDKNCEKRNRYQTKSQTNKGRKNRKKRG